MNQTYAGMCIAEGCAVSGLGRVELVLDLVLHRLARLDMQDLYRAAEPGGGEGVVLPRGHHHRLGNEVISQRSGAAPEFLPASASLLDQLGELC